ncbi:MAG: hypothetical protein ACYCUM_14285 [Solirubrobacteraceae bacterium]
MRTFIVQESIHGDGPTHHETEAEAIAVITEMIKQGVAEPGEFSIREMDDSGHTVRAFTPPSPAPAKIQAA